MQNHLSRATYAKALSALLIGAIAIVAGLVPDPAGADSSSPSNSASSSTTSGPKPGSTSDLAGRATFGIGPITLGKTDNRSFFSYEMGTGTTYSDKAAVVNYGVASLQLSVFAADLGNNDDGGIAVGLQADTPKDAGSWIELPGKLLTATVPPRNSKGPGQVIVPFTVHVPATASPGDHGAAIVASLSTLGKNPQGQNVKLDQRVATRIYLRVNGPLHPALTIDNLKVNYHQSLNPIGGGSALVHYTVHNTGNVRLSAQQAVSVTGMFGIKSKVVTPDGVQLLFPGGSQDVSVKVDGVLPSIFEKSHVTVTPELFQDQKQMAVPTAAANVGFTAVPWMLLLCVAVLILLVVAVWLLRRRAKLQPSSRHSRKSAAPKKGFGPNPGPTPEIGS